MGGRAAEAELAGDGGAWITSCVSEVIVVAVVVASRSSSLGRSSVCRRNGGTCDGDTALPLLCACTCVVILIAKALV